MRALAAISMTLFGCFGVPQDAVVEQLTVKAWNGNVGACQEMQVDLLAETTSRGACNAVDPATAVAVDPAIIDQIQGGISRSQFAAANVNPPPGCAECPIRSYSVRMSSESEGASTQGRIVPDQSLLDALVPLAPP